MIDNVKECIQVALQGIPCKLSMRMEGGGVYEEISMDTSGIPSCSIDVIDVEVLDEKSYPVVLDD
jgi:hypothetical protein